ncbi:MULTISPECIES: hypothetical protein [Aliiglaciecola]|uniref:hypothetical protein n=1 Tax=Aliiglaciecola TaxID=1406885 RepID=UPI001C08D0FA|nr:MULTISPECIES: hypothetical protein [Aliiglaciecola]MBU2877079.1 hypothetical protein [Aliiglaciecola lipolytica]MDO6710201.1 hypothetical protein [Aliiglaciecola sp. 2_MG-2023]MDO6751349.1 hypothetical protein [Aliiglaciecola sp. 1_MG-2023]
MQLSRFFFMLIVSICAAFTASCATNKQPKETLSTMDSAKVNFHYVKVNTDNLKVGHSSKSHYTLSVFMDVKNGKIHFDSESVNSVGVGWSGSYELYQELACQEYSHAYLCIPSIGLAIPISTFQTENTWTHNSLSYTNKGMQRIAELDSYGEVFVINATQSGGNKSIYTYYLSLKKGLVAFSKGDSHDLWVLSEKNSFGVGALSLGKSLNTNSLSISDIKNYSVVKMIN